MKIINAYKAQRVIEPVESRHIVIEQEMPNFTLLSEQDKVCDKEASSLENALYKSLPGATYDRLLGVMLERKASHFRVSHEAK